MSGFDVVDIEVLMELHFQFKATCFVVFVFEFTFEGFSLSADGENSVLEFDLDVVFGEAGEGDGEVETGIIAAGFKAGSFGRDF